LDAEQYITPDSGVIHLLLNAVRKKWKNSFDLRWNELEPCRALFCWLLSIMESNDTIKLYRNRKISLDGLDSI
jgi:hypothetical protein